MPANPNTNYGTGRRKTATARVYLQPGSGRITVNQRTLDEFGVDGKICRHVWTSTHDTTH